MNVVKFVSTSICRTAYLTKCQGCTVYDNYDVWSVLQQQILTVMNENQSHYNKQNRIQDIREYV
jgi:hypothetical protein